MALRLHVKRIDKETLKRTILELLENKKYSDAAKLRSRNFRDQKETPIERALWWVDYVARNEDVSFLKSGQLMRMGYFVKYSIDVIAFLLGVLLVAVLVTLKVVCLLVKCFRRRNKGGKSGKKVKRN